MKKLAAFLLSFAIIFTSVVTPTLAAEVCDNEAPALSVAGNEDALSAAANENKVTVAANEDVKSSSLDGEEASEDAEFEADAKDEADAKNEADANDETDAQILANYGGKPCGTLTIDDEVHVITSDRPGEQINSVLAAQESIGTVLLSLSKNMVLEKPLEFTWIPSLTINLNKRKITCVKGYREISEGLIYVYYGNECKIYNGTIDSTKADVSSNMPAISTVGVDLELENVKAAGIGEGVITRFDEGGVITETKITGGAFKAVKGTYSNEPRALDIATGTIIATSVKAENESDIIASGDAKFSKCVFSGKGDTYGLSLSVAGHGDLGSVSATGKKGGLLLKPVDFANVLIRNGSYMSSGGSGLTVEPVSVDNTVRCNLDIRGGNFDAGKPKMNVEQNNRNYGLKILSEDGMGGKCNCYLYGGTYSSIYSHDLSGNVLNPIHLLGVHHSYVIKGYEQTLIATEPIHEKVTVKGASGRSFNIYYQEAENYVKPGVELVKLYTPSDSMANIKLPTASSFDRPGYILSGFNNEATGKKISKITKKNTGHIYLTPIWKEVSYKINFRLNGGKFQSSKDKIKSYKYGDAIIFANPVKKGFSFEGWYTDSSFAESSARSRIVESDYGDIVLYAKWRELPAKWDELNLDELYPYNRTPSEEDKNSDNGRMAYNVYLKPSFPDLKKEYTAMSIDFRIQEAPEGTYYALCVGSMKDVMPEGAAYYTKEMNAEKCQNRGGFYGGIQRLDGTQKVIIGSQWDTDYFIGGEAVHKEASLLYGEDVIAHVTRFGGEGTGARSRTKYDWMPGKWYRYVDRCYNTTVNGKKTTVRDNWIQDKSSGKWTLISRYDTGLENSSFAPGFYQFMENFAPAYCWRTRAIQWGNLYVMEKGSDEWQFINNATVSADSEITSGNKKGGFAFGATEDYFWGITCGVGDRIEDANPGVKKSGNYTVKSFDSAPNLNKLAKY